ncbi:phosphoribosylanthranilate isomerase [Marinobacter zhejiangensis]|uniref:N-(5'-phosphoribosyl)anthranilate isomerase n=1 Tax=Marinobacter zhejiangensis TaxID=488535 RepID=A0A1I4RT92_9GAMM|nr:phosphoribosylanthranilate isomerase [Marinobacter zhejiangensis]SFM55502.1 phosphoribosylanthranilate isomerase [Marinobacter zhejiangensis]
MNSRIKICGITKPEDARVAADAGADAIGLVFYEPSPRAVSLEAAEEVVKAIPAFVTVVGLFVNPDRAFVEEVLKRIPLDLLQFHGDETPEFCRQFNRRWIKAVRVRNAADINSAFARFYEACGLLVDAFDPAHYGGTGKCFDWTMIPEKRPLPLILAGGLNSDNVARAVEQVRPWAVDVSGGVEIRKGVKDHKRMTDFLKEVQRVNKTY